MKTGASVAANLARVCRVTWPVFLCFNGMCIYCGPALAAERQNAADEVRSVATLSGAAQQNALRMLLATAEGGKDFMSVVFYHEAELRDSLLALAGDPKVGASAREMLVFIGIPQDVRLALQLSPAPQRDTFKNRWAYRVACALLEPSTEEEWAFLREAALGYLDDRWVDYGAIQTLKLIGSPRSAQILEETRNHNPGRVKSAGRALEYVRSNPPPMADADLVALAVRVAEVAKFGEWEGNSPPRFNQGGDKALVDCVIRDGSGPSTYTATFHRVEGVWRLRGIRETLHQFDTKGLWAPMRPDPVLEIPALSNAPADPHDLPPTPRWLRGELEQAQPPH
jgi:hypothetical protein